MAKIWENPNDREKRRAILRKAELEINLAEREVQEWKLHRRESPKCLDINNKSQNLSEILSKTPNNYSPALEFAPVSPSITSIEKRIKDMEIIRQTENDKHRKEIERLEAMIDKMQNSRKNDQKVEFLQQAFEEKSREVLIKNKEISELRTKIKNNEPKKNKNINVRCNSQESIDSQRKNKSLLPKTLKNNYDNKQLEKEVKYWKNKAYELSNKYFAALKSMREEISKIKNDSANEWKVFRQGYQNVFKKITG
jgi:hypothetical protein